VFSTGVVLYEMLTGQAPFTAPDLHMLLYRIVNETPPSASRLRPGVPVEIDRLLARCLAKQPNLRPASARELYVELKKIATLEVVKQPVGIGPKGLRPLALFAFSIPILVFLSLSVGLIVINYFITRQPAMPTAPAPAPTVPVPLTKAGGAAEESPAGSAHRSRQAFDRPRLTQQTPASDAYLVKLDKKLAELRVKRAEMLSSYTELHPDVVMLDRQIAQMENERAEYLEDKRHGAAP
jgi:serine/threonine-protein kinase